MTESKTHKINPYNQLCLASSGTFDLDWSAASLILAQCRLWGAGAMHAVGLAVAASACASIAGWLGSAVEGGMPLGVGAGMDRRWMMGHLLLLGWWHRTLRSWGVGIVGIARGAAKAVLRRVHGQTGGGRCVVGRGRDNPVGRRYEGQATAVRVVCGGCTVVTISVRIAL